MDLLGELARIGKRILEKTRSQFASLGDTKPLVDNSPQYRPPLNRPQFSGRRFFLALLTSLIIGVTLFASMAESAWAAIELAYYRAAATNNAIFLEWATVREYNVNGFEILCKRIGDPATAFHPIASRIAKGNANAGATYNFDVTSGLTPGERYCFRLREITTDGTPGEAFDLCGYGLGLMPEVTVQPLTVDVNIPITLTPTVVTVQQVPGVDTAPTVPPTVAPDATATQTFDPFATPTIDPFAVPTQPVSELATPTPTLPIDPNAEATAQSQSVSPLPTPLGLDADGTAGQASTDATVGDVPTETPTEFPTPTPTEMPTQEPTVTATLTNTMPVTVAQGVDVNGGLPILPDSSAALAAAEATPTPLYVVVTATPTPLPAVVVAPTFTPWPTAVPTQTFGLSNLLVPNTQNLMVGLLCLIFMSASGLGVLGLITSVLYMRSQTRMRDRLPGPVYERRRY